MTIEGQSLFCVFFHIFVCQMFFYRYIKRSYVLNPIHEKQKGYIVLLYKKREELTANNKKVHKNLRKISAENY